MQGELIRIFIEICLDVAVCGTIEIIMRQTVTLEEKLSYYVSLTLLITSAVGLIYSIALIQKSKLQIEQP